MAQTVYYQFDVNDTATYEVSCGETTSAFWRTVGDSCSIILSTDSVAHCEGDQAIPLEITLNPTGNLECDDRIYMEVNCDTAWIAFDTIFGCNITAVTTFTYNIPCVDVNTCRLRVTFVTDHKSEKIQIRDGEIIVYDPCLQGLLPIFNVNLTSTQRAGGIFFEWDFEMTYNTTGSHWLEKSVNGRDFERISNVMEIQGTTKSGYSSWDASLHADKGYYRVACIDESGQVKYSNVIVVYNEAVVTVDMNYYNEGELLWLHAGGYVHGELEIYSMGGQLVQQDRISLDQREGWSMDMGEALTQPGIYIAVFRQPTGISKLKFSVL